MIIFFRSWWKSNKLEKKNFFAQRWFTPSRTPPPRPEPTPFIWPLLSRFDADPIKMVMFTGGRFHSGGGGSKIESRGKNSNEPRFEPSVWAPWLCVDEIFFVTAAIFCIRLTVQLLPCLSGSINRWCGQIKKISSFTHRLALRRSPRRLKMFTIQLAAVVA